MFNLLNWYIVIFRIFFVYFYDNFVLLKSDKCVKGNVIVILVKKFKGYGYDILVNNYFFDINGYIVLVKYF